jgi:GcrA cell cycle regulator
MTWTEQKIQMLKDMWGNGFSASEIAKRLGGLTRNAVIGKAHRLKLSGRPSPIKREDGSTTPAKNTGMTRATTKKVMLRPLPMPPAPPTNLRQTPAINRVSVEQEKRPATSVSPLKSGERQCRWPIGDPRSADFRFCGCLAHEGLPYCTDHARMAYQNFGRMRRGDEGELG